MMLSSIFYQCLVIRVSVIEPTLRKGHDERKRQS